MLKTPGRNFKEAAVSEVLALYPTGIVVMLSALGNCFLDGGP